MENSIDALVGGIAREAVEKLDGLSQDPYFRIAIMKAGLREMCLRFAELDGISGDELGDHLVSLSERFRERRRPAAGDAQDGERPAKAPPGYFGPKTISGTPGSGRPS